MYFMEEEALRGLEQMMRGNPNFAPRGQGLAVLGGYRAGDRDCRDCAYRAGRGRGLRCGLDHCVCLEERIRAGTAACREILAGAMSGVRYPPLLLRFHQYLAESGESLMEYRNEKHRAAFAAAAGQDAGNYKLMAALYLLTADGKLWDAAGQAVERGGIRFGSIRLRGSSEDGYIVELVHSGGFSSVYQGLSEICVAMGDEVSAAQVIGNTASGQMTFSLLCDGSEVDPLEYLFR